MPSNPPPPPGARRRNIPSRQAAREYGLAEATLGWQHPLVAALRSTRIAGEQALTVTAVQAAGLILMLEQVSVAVPLVLACAATQVALGLRIVYLASRKRAAGCRLIFDGRDQLPIPTVQGERRRLDDTRYQATLAHSIHDLADGASQRRLKPPCPPPIYHPEVVLAVAAQLHEIAGLLDSDGTPVRGVAHVEALITSGASALYGTDVDQLVQELGRARYFLVADHWTEYS